MTSSGIKVMVYGRSEAMEKGDMRMGTALQPTWTSEKHYGIKTYKQPQNVCLCMNERDSLYFFSITSLLHINIYIYCLFYLYQPGTDEVKA